MGPPAGASGLWPDPFRTDLSCSPCAGHQAGAQVPKPRAWVGLRAGWSGEEAETPPTPLPTEG